MKITKIFALIFFAAAQIFAQESSEDSFNDIDNFIKSPTVPNSINT